jgi:GWxTD domain-containing protein
LTCSTAPRLRLRVAALLLAGLALAGCASGGGKTPGLGHGLADLTNPALGPDYAQWLVGPISFLATKEEVATYLGLKDDAAAQEFIARFWARRNPPNRPQNPLLAAFEARGAEADRLYSEAGFQGRRTDRGTIHVIYGPPKKVDFEVAPAGGSPIEVWTYGTDAASGLNGRKPAPRYRFRKRGDLTVFYLAGPDPLQRGLHGPG